MDESSSSFSTTSSSIIQPRNILTLLVALFTGGCIYVATICIYRLFLHPFAHVPGPLLARLTDAYGLYHAWFQDTHLAIHQLHVKYGAIVRYGPNRILVNDVHGMKEIYGYNANFAKGKVYEALKFNPVHSVFNATDKNMHRRKRKLVGQGFSEAALRASEECILKHVDRFLDGLLGDDRTSHQDGDWVTSKDLSTYCALEVDISFFFPKEIKLTVNSFDSKLSSFGYHHRPGFWQVYRCLGQA
jgi:hypothetical protein